MLIAFILSMPGRNSWNGRWSGEQSVYAIIRSIRGTKREAKAREYLGHHSYNFGDGWRASVEVREIAGDEARSLRKRSKGFCGYEWMIESIVRDGAIYGPTQPKPEPAANAVPVP